MTSSSNTEAPVRVVIAEDEAIIRLDLKEILESAGYIVVGETGRGDEAVDLVAQHAPELAILDLKMPGLDGLEVARRIFETSHTAVLILTAFSQRELIDQAREAGVVAYLVKPYRREELLPAIEAALDSSRQEQAIEADVAAAGEDTADAARIAEDKIQTRRIVDEAKAVLMDRHDLSEPEAFSFVQRTAMQNRLRMRDVARKVVDGELVP